MNKISTPIEGTWVIEPKRFLDNRGFFAPLFSKQQFTGKDLCVDFDRVNTSYSEKVGTLRGMHYQRSPYQETKLIRVIQGSIWDVILDIRKDSPTFGQYFGVELNAINRKMVYIPKGCAHGFITLMPETEVLYLASSEYMPSHEMGIRWDDPLFSIQWPLTPTVISDKDQKLANYTEIQ